MAVEQESGGVTEEGSFNWLGESPVVGSYDRSSEEDSFDWLGTAPEPAAAEPAAPITPEPVVPQPVATETPATELDRARIAKYLGQALAEDRLEPGEHAARTLALWSATTTRELARLVVDLPVPADEPLRDRKFDHRADDLIAPADRQGVLDRLNHAMAGHRLTLWEYETRLDVALNARTYGELWPAVAGLR